MKSKLLQLLKNKTAHIILLLFVLAYVFHAGFKTYYNYGVSMEPTLRNHQLLMVNKIWYEIVPISRYDVVIIDAENEYLCKRIVALPNETIEIINGKIFVNDKPLRGDPIRFADSLEAKITNFPRTELNADECFFIGDNRYESVFGITSIDDIRGKVMMLK